MLKPRFKLIKGTYFLGRGGEFKKRRFEAGGAKEYREANEDSDGTKKKTKEDLIF